MFKNLKFILLIILMQQFSFADQEIVNNVSINNNQNTPSLEIKTYNLDICKQCNGYHWEKKALGLSQIVSTMNQESINKSLIGYVNGSYGGVMKNIMKGHLKNYSEQDLNNISNQIKPTNDPFFNKN